LTQYLLDTNVVSALSPSVQAQHPAVEDWLRENGPALYLPTVVIAELSAGIAGLQRKGAVRKAEALDLWMTTVLRAYAGRILPLDAEAAHATGLLLDRAQAVGLHPGFADLAIAGIATARGMVLLTRNLRHFAPLGVAARDPFADSQS